MVRNRHMQACELIPPEGHIQNSTNNSPLEVLFPCGDYSRSSRQPGHMQVTLLQTPGVSQLRGITLRVPQNRLCLRGIWTLYKTWLGSDLGHYFSSKGREKMTSFNADFLLWWQIFICYSCQMTYPPTLAVPPVQCWSFRAGTGYIYRCTGLPVHSSHPCWFPLFPSLSLLECCLLTGPSSCKDHWGGLVLLDPPQLSAQWKAPPFHWRWRIWHGWNCK